MLIDEIRCRKDYRLFTAVRDVIRQYLTEEAHPDEAIAGTVTPLACRTNSDINDRIISVTPVAGVFCRSVD